MTAALRDIPSDEVEAFDRDRSAKRANTVPDAGHEQRRNPWTDPSFRLSLIMSVVSLLAMVISCVVFVTRADSSARTTVEAVSGLRGDVSEIKTSLGNMNTNQARLDQQMRDKFAETDKFEADTRSKLDQLFAYAQQHSDRLSRLEGKQK